MPTVTPAELNEIGPQIANKLTGSGAGWQSKLARVMNVHVNTVWRWSNGKQAISESRANHIRLLAGKE